MTSGQLIGATTANIAEVEAATLAMRVTQRDLDYGALGHYSIANVSGIMGAAVTASQRMFSFRWTSNAAQAAIEQIMLSVACDTVAFPAASPSIFRYYLFGVRSFIASDTGGTSITPTGDMNSLRTSMGASLVGDIRIASTGPLTQTAGNDRDNEPMSGVTGAIPAVIAGQQIIPPTYLFDARPGEQPMILAANEGFVIQTSGNAYPGTGTWKFSVKVRWSERVSFP